MNTFGRRTRVGVLGALVACLVFATAEIGFSQVTGNILGRVTDSTGAVVPGAPVEITNVGTGASRTVQTDAGGRYAVPNLPSGTYNVTIRQSGFQTQVRRGVTVSVGQDAVVNLALAVGNVQETVEVTAEAPMIETTNATVSSLVSGEQIRDLPLNGRSVDRLALLVPGTLQDHAVNANSVILGTGMRLSVNGNRPDSNLFLLDGTMTNDQTMQGPSSGTGSTLGVEGVQEFRLITHNFSAEYGRSSGAVMNTVTRSGTNSFHGSLYEFHRNDDLDARNFFNPGELPAFVRNQFGAAVGGPVIRDRIFFFSNFEAIRERRGISLLGTVPTAAARRGDLGSRQVPVNPIMVPYLNIWPLPNGQDYGNGLGELTTNVSSVADENYYMNRGDLRLGDNDSFYARYVYDPSEQSAPNNVPVFGRGARVTSHFATISETHIFSGAALNEFRMAFNRNDPQDLQSWLIGDGFKELAFVPGQDLGQLRPSSAGSAFAGVFTDYGSARADQFFINNVFQVTDTVSITHGAHSLKLGGDFQKLQINTGYGRPRGEMRFDTLEDVLAGKSRRFRGLPPDPTISTRRGFRRSYVGLFVQDDWRATPNLTLNLGLRWEMFTNVSEVNGRIGALVDPLDPAMTDGIAPFETAKANFAPRFGIAWDPTGSGKTSIRGGGGIFFNHPDGRTYWRAAALDSDYQKEITVKNPTFPNPFAGGYDPSGAVYATSTFQPHMDTPTVYQYNFEIQHQLAPTLSVQAAYVGSVGHDLIRKTWANIAAPTILPDGRKFWTGKEDSPNPNFADIERLISDARFNYNSLQAGLQKNLSAGLMMGLSYTYGKNMSDADQLINSQTGATQTVAQDQDNLAADYGLSVYSQAQTLSLNGSYDMPFGRNLTSAPAKAILGGWNVSWIYSYGTGLPLDIFTGFENSRQGNPDEHDRPNLVPGASQNPVHGVTAGCPGIAAGEQLRTAQRWFDPCAFELPDIGTFGNLGRNTMIGPTNNNIDLTLTKRTQITESKSLEFRAEFFNLFNRAYFAAPQPFLMDKTGFHNGNEGRVSATAIPNREIQLGLKLVF